MEARVSLVPALSDNYIYVIHWEHKAIVIDPADAAPVWDFLLENDLKLTHILNTHHHADHIGGNQRLRTATQSLLIGPPDPRIPAVDTTVEGGSTFTIAPFTFKVFSVPGHTSSHIAFYEAGRGWLFCGDSLFAGGCGRLFEGTAEQMWQSLRILRELPDDTQIFCGHEYTLSNLNFAVTVDPTNEALKARLDRVKGQREAGEATLPSVLGEEKATNPFLRADSPELKEALGMQASDPVEVFAEIRSRKDHF